MLIKAGECYVKLVNDKLCQSMMSEAGAWKLDLEIKRKWGEC